VPFLDRRAYDAARPPRRRHASEHAPLGNPCVHVIRFGERAGEYCGLPAEKHRQLRPEYHAERDDRKAEKLFIGVDGEGLDVCASCEAPWDSEAGVCICGCKRTRHLYTYLCAASEEDEVLADAYNAKGLTHAECVEVLLALPKHSLKFGFMLSYDLTKILEEVPDDLKYKLLRPELRTRSICKICGKGWTVPTSKCPRCRGPKAYDYYKPVQWQGRAYDFFNGSFSVRDGFDKKTKKWERACKVWDVFRFFGCAFVEAIESWGVASPSQLERISSMKKKRGSFAQESVEEIKKYCQEECALLAQMMRRLVDGHEEAGWKLKAYYGAGSTGAAMLEANGVRNYRGKGAWEQPAELRNATMCAFFGGRFENAAIGRIGKPLWSKDIASAYPYALTFLPCLLCGHWRKVSGRGTIKEVERARLALCHFKVKALGDRKRREMAWAPLPYRDEAGSIAFPLNFEGWAWKPEILAALKGWPEIVEVIEAWVYDTPCDHKPFGFVPEAYKQRIAWGKEGKGLTIKLGLNSGYGKTAQSVGSAPPFQSWAWAGNVTSSCRAQALWAIMAHSDPWNMLTVATDGVVSLEDAPLAKPVDTGTAGLLSPKGEKKEPLGGWESEAIPEGMFIVKPGMYFRLDTELKKLRARGIGRRELFDARVRLMTAFAQWDRKSEFKVQIDSRRFWGARSTVYGRSRCPACDVTWPGTVNLLCPKCRAIGKEFSTYRQTDAAGNDVYGTWGKRTIDIRFDPHPKRERGVGKGEWSRLFVRDVGGKVSVAYVGKSRTPEAELESGAAEMMGDQPDADPAGGIGFGVE
jgi:DNA polymerase type B, organellar and viral